MHQPMRPWELADKLRDTLGKLKPGDPIPAAREVGRRWGVPEGVAQQAYALLEIDGLVDRHGPWKPATVAAPGRRRHPRQS